jgi:predicted nucleotide-binding protein
MPKPRVFISQSYSDNGWAREFANSLQERGLRVWFDAGSIRVGRSITEALEKGLRESNVIALLVTPDTIKRPNLFFEIGAAMGMGKKLIPVVSKDVDLKTLPPSLRERGYLIRSSPEATAEEFASEAASVFRPA